MKGGALFIAGEDVASYKLEPTDLGSFLSGVAEEVESFSPPGVHRAIPSGTFITQPRTSTVTFLLNERDPDERRAALSEARKLFRRTTASVSDLRAAAPKEVEIRLGDSELVTYAVYQGGDRARHFDGNRLLYTGRLDLPVDFVQYDPAWYWPESESVEVTATPVAVELGDMPSWWTFEIEGPGVTDPELIFYADDEGAPGAEIFRITLVGTLGSGVSWFLDAIRHRIVQVGGATPGIVTDTVMPSGFFRQIGENDEEKVWVKVTDGTGTFSWRRRIR